MLLWLAISYIIFVAVLIAYSAHVAISCADPAKRADAYKVLKLIWATGTGVSGLTLFILNALGKLHDLGLS